MAKLRKMPGSAHHPAAIALMRLTTTMETFPASSLPPKDVKPNWRC